ncbi:MAG: hypothetical protein LUH13_01670 [Oscillospiraceae bacterium]|nr:hypothetical protein [Oscillospiraceae bacterium]
MVTEVRDLLDRHLPRGVDNDVSAFDCLLDHGGITPLVYQLRIIDPQDGATMATGCKGGGNPGDRFLVDQVVAAIKAVLVCKDHDLLLCTFDSSAYAVVNHVGQEFPRLLRDTNLGCHSNFLLKIFSLVLSPDRLHEQKKSSGLSAGITPSSNSLHTLL